MPEVEVSNEGAEEDSLKNKVMELHRQIIKAQEGTQIIHLFIHRRLYDLSLQILS